MIKSLARVRGLSPNIHVFPGRSLTASEKRLAGARPLRAQLTLSGDSSNSSWLGHMGATTIGEELETNPLFTHPEKYM